ncbi:MAG: TIGR03619 family F420-dependent LLM class oxidoreductase [Acidimicrobiales bacterium]|jgi:probable F420-dependent oxidoreductase|nr:TIGR03619 family F420-dependent LLM class oxidoreductase [Acidimicrobiales bacterium]
MAAITAGDGWSFGLQLPIQTLTRTLVDPWEDDATVDDLVTIASRCDDRGYDFVGVCDHVAIPDNAYASRMTTTWYDTIATLAYLAAKTQNTRLLSVVWIAGYRHPLQTAKSFGTLDHLSGGRAILGVGAGHVEAEFDALGVDFKTRGKRLDDTLDAVRGAFADTYVSHEGDFYSYADVGVAPQPANELPIWVGGSGRASWRRTGRVGDGYIPMGNGKEQYAEIIDTVGAAGEAAGRSAATFDIGYMPPWTYLLGDVPEGVMALSGGIEPLAEDIRAAREVGANTIHLKFRSRDVAEYLEQVDAFVEQVVPLVNEA